MQQTARPNIPSSDPEALRSLGSEIAATCAGFNLRRASRAVSQHFDHALAPLGLRSTQFTLLGALALSGQATTSRLAHALVMDRTTLTRNLKLLRETGLIEAQPAPTGRQICFSLTEAGRETLTRAIPVWRTAQSSIVDQFGEAHWPGMVAELKRLVSGMHALTAEAAEAAEAAEMA
ncbi:MAG: MarR family winged helix-turn-helix transcriptional regulator [Chloroflexota bacterium]